MLRNLWRLKKRTYHYTYQYNQQSNIIITSLCLQQYGNRRLFTNCQQRLQFFFCRVSHTNVHAFFMTMAPSRLVAQTNGNRENGVSGACKTGFHRLSSSSCMYSCECNTQNEPIRHICHVNVCTCVQIRGIICGSATARDSLPRKGIHHTHII